MKEIPDKLESVNLFRGIEPENLAALLNCIGAKIIEAKNGTPILLAGEQAERVGILLNGRLHIVRDAIDGGRTLIAEVTEGEVFADALCCSGIAESPVSVVADTNVSLMWIEFQRILYVCPHTCPFHLQMIKNMIRSLAVNYLWLLTRIEFLSKKSIRDRLMSYLESVAAKEGRDFSIPFNRGELADFLCIDRSALSRELGRLKKEGVIDYWKNQFKLLV